MRHIIVTGGAGFVGSTLALTLKQRHPEWKLTAFDNLRRRGSELALGRLKEAGVAFVHGDVRSPDDVQALGPADAMLECSAEPSVHAGVTSSASYLVSTNLMGAFHCLEWARAHRAGMIFVSTSRVYPMHRISGLSRIERETRFEIDTRSAGIPGLSDEGIAEEFPLDGARSIYGTTKLSAELLIQEYVEAFGLRAFINRCGVIAGPWQMGKVDQGFLVLWVASHVFGRPLRYIGFGGTGKQVRDVLHVADLAELVDLQLARLDEGKAQIWNVGGGRTGTVSLLELTALCQQATGNTVPITGVPETRFADIPWYCTDSRRAGRDWSWAPQRDVPLLVEDIARWVTDNRSTLERTLEF
jgi:CDP-paratose 2-epimerase